MLKINNTGMHTNTHNESCNCHEDCPVNIDRVMVGCLDAIASAVDGLPAYEAYLVGTAIANIWNYAQGNRRSANLEEVIYCIRRLQATGSEMLIGLNSAYIDCTPCIESRGAQ